VGASGDRHDAGVFNVVIDFASQCSFVDIHQLQPRGGQPISHNADQPLKELKTKIVILSHSLA
jgi:hypothetical protein